MSPNDSQDTRGRKPRNYYVDYTKAGINNKDRRRAHTRGSAGNSRFKETPDVTFGHRGFLITSVDEVKSYLEMRNILEDYHEQLYTKKDNVDDQTMKALSTEDELESELKALRKNRPFKQVKTHCRNTLFINIVPDFSYIDPSLIVDRFFNELAANRQVKTSNTYKVLPIFDTFRSSVACIKESLSNLIKNKFMDGDDSRKYFIEFQSRGNFKLSPDDKQKMIEGIADTLTELKPNWSVDRDNCDYMIVLIALKNVSCISIVQNYFSRSKYNVVEFCKDFTPSVTDQLQKIESSIPEIGLSDQADD